MDRGTRIYTLVLTAFILGLVILFLYQDPKVSDLNDNLENDAEIEAFPYRFTVVSVGNGIATISTPRSTEVPVERILGILFPQVVGRKAGSAEFQKAQKELARIQTKARDIVLSDPEIKSMRWQLDRSWLSQHGVILQH